MAFYSSSLRLTMKMLTMEKQGMIFQKLLFLEGEFVSKINYAMPRQIRKQQVGESHNSVY